MLKYGLSSYDFFRSPQNREYLEYLQEAESLLRQIRRIKVGESEESPYIKDRENYLNKLYGDYSLYIQGLWELLGRNDVYRPRYRRNLAYAYWVENGREWDKLGEKNWKRVRELMEENLLAEPGNSHDIRLWFEAARRLPDTGLKDAIEKLAYWVNIANTIDLLDAYYYLYVLQAIRAIEDSSLDAAIQAQKSIKQSKKIAQEQDRANRTWSLDWLGKQTVDQKGVSRLIPRSRLGEFNKLFEDNPILQRLSGRIEEISKRQAGKIKAYGLEFFFTPSPKMGHQFVQGRDENTPVTFFVAFSYDGPRAWDVKPTD